MTDVTWASRAHAFATDRFFLLQTLSGLRSAAWDPEGGSHFLPPDSSDEVLGQALMDCLDRSRQIAVEEVDRFFDPKLSKQLYEASVERMLKESGYKSRHKLFKNMLCCWVDRKQEVITIRPTCHERLEAWSGKGIDESDLLRVMRDASASVIGASLRAAFARCR